MLSPNRSLAVIHVSWLRQAGSLDPRPPAGRAGRGLRQPDSRTCGPRQSHLVGDAAPDHAAPSHCSPCGGSGLRAPLGTQLDHVPRLPCIYALSRRGTCRWQACPQTAPPTPGPPAACLPNTEQGARPEGQRWREELGPLKEQSPGPPIFSPTRVPTVQPHWAVT